MRGGGGHGMNDFLRVSTNKIRSLVLRTSSFHPVWAQYQRSKSFACYEEGGKIKQEAWHSLRNMNIYPHTVHFPFIAWFAFLFLQPVWPPPEAASLPSSPSLKPLPGQIGAPRHA